MPILTQVGTSKPSFPVGSIGSGVALGIRVLIGVGSGKLVAVGAAGVAVDVGVLVKVASALWVAVGRMVVTGSASICRVKVGLGVIITVGRSATTVSVGGISLWQP